MLDAHAAHAEVVTRWAMAVAMVGAGVAAFAWPRCFAGVAGYFTRWAAKMPPDEQERLTRVVDAREAAEGISANFGRVLGAGAVLLATLEAVRSLPPILPYALFCLAVAAITLLAYLQFRRAVERRVAPLVRRSPFTALPVALIVAVALSFLASLALAAYPPERFGALAVAASTLLLGVIAWRIAMAPALLLGIDPRLEYAVDERVRIGRARSIANLACAPAFVVIALAAPTLPAQYAILGSVAFAIVAVSFAVSLAGSLLPLRRPIVAV
jgi:hypothetical protein